MSVLIPVLLAVWLVFSALSQLPYAMRRGSRWRALGLLPTWYFFNHPLAAREIHLVYRRVSEAGDMPWQQVPLAGSRGWRRALWHPERRAGKVLLDIAAQILTMRVRLRLGPEAIRDSAAYRAALELVKAGAKLRPGDLVQFALEIGEADASAAPPRIGFLSEVHRL